MKTEEIFNIIGAIIILTVIIGFVAPLTTTGEAIAKALLFAIIIILANVLVKKVVAYNLDADVEHEIWKVSRYGWKPNHYFKREVPAGIILPLFFALFSLGLFKFMALLTYETRALTQRAAKRFGYYSYTEMTEWHNSLIGAAGIIAVLLVSLISYFSPWSNEILWRMASFYAFFNMLPLSKLDGTQIFFGSRVLWSALAIITFIFTSYALFLP